MFWDPSQVGIRLIMLTPKVPPNYLITIQSEEGPQAHQAPYFPPPSLALKLKFYLKLKSFFRTLVCHLLSLLAFQIKSFFLAPTPCFSDYWPVMQWVVYSKLQKHTETIKLKYWRLFNWSHQLVTYEWNYFNQHTLSKIKSLSDAFWAEWKV